MNAKNAIILLVLIAAAIGIGRWRFAAVAGGPAADPLGKRLTIDYQGTVGQLFQMLSQRSGMQYQVDPAVANRTVQGSYKGKSVVEIQDDAGRQAHLRYRPLDMSGKTIVVGPG